MLQASQCCKCLQATYIEHKTRGRRLELEYPYDPCY
jgi:hypothetical protein